MVAWQRSLFDPGETVETPMDEPVPPITGLGDGAWVAYHPRWLRRPDLLFDHLSTTVPWRLEQREMYDRVVEVPRLVAFYGEDQQLPHPVLDDVRSTLNRRFGGGGAGSLRTTGICLYRDGRDSVAWHGDRIGREDERDTLVAIVSIGSRRRFLLRPASGGPALRYSVGEGDLLVMGGTCQRTWQHAVPKVARPVGPRISIQFRS
jgi:alkylated DNA repair dioxygenase AlkB